MAPPVRDWRAALTVARAHARDWLPRHVLHVSTLPPPAAAATRCGLGLVLLSMLTMAAAVLLGPEQGLAMEPDAGPWLYLTACVVALTTTATGTGLCYAGLCSGPTGRPRRLFAGACVGVVAVPTCSLLFSIGQDGGATRSDVAVAVWPLWAGVAVVLVALIATRGRGLGRPADDIAVLLVPFASVVVAGLVTTALLGMPALGGTTVLGGLLPFFGLIITASVGLLVWVAAEGLRVSRDAAVGLLDRAGPPLRLVVVLLMVKAVLLGVAAMVTVGPDPGPGAQVQPWLPGAGAFLWAAPLAAGALLLLVPRRLPGLTEDGFTDGARAVGALTLLPLGVVTPFLYSAIGLTALSRPPVLLGAGVLVAVVVLGLLAARGRPWWIGSVLLVAATGATAVHVTGAGTLRAVDLGAGPSEENLRWYLGGLALVGLLGLLALMSRAGFRRGLVLLAALATWIVLTVLPGSLGGGTGATPVAFDVLLTIGVAGLALAWARGWQRRVDPRGLVLLLVITTAVVEVPVLLELLDDRWAGLLLAAAVVAPVLSQLTLDVAPLNRPGPGRLRTVLLAVGAMCLCYGLTAAVVVGIGSLVLVVVAFLSDYVTGMVLVPLAVLLAVLTGSRLAEAEAEAEDPAIR